MFSVLTQCNVKMSLYRLCVLRYWLSWHPVSIQLLGLDTVIAQHIQQLFDVLVTARFEC